jgi:hypothetical protein
VGSPGTVTGLCPACYLNAEQYLEQVMRGTLPLHAAPRALAAWWFAGDNNSWLRISPVLHELEAVADHYWGLYNYPKPKALGLGPSFAELCELRGEPERAKAHRATVEAVLRDWEARR